MSVPSELLVYPNEIDSKTRPESGKDVRIEPTFREYCRIVSKHWRLIVIPFVVAMVLAFVVLHRMTLLYTASSTILIEPRAPRILDIKQPGLEETDQSDTDEFYNTQYKILQSRSLAREVIAKLGLDENRLFASAPGNQHAAEHSIDEYLAHLGITPEPGTHLVRVSFTSADPRLAAKIVNAHVQAYIARGSELRAQASESAEQFLREKLVGLKRRVEHSEAALNNYQRTRGIVGGSSDDKAKVALARLTSLNNALTNAETERVTLDAEARLLHSGNYNSLPAVLNEPVIQRLKEQEARAEGNYASLASEYKRDYPPLMAVGSRLRNIRGQLRKETDRVVAGLRWSIAAVTERERELRQKVDTEKTRIAALNSASLREAILEREVSTSRDLYKTVLTRMNELGMTAGISASNVSIVDAAESPAFPSSPKTGLTLTSVAIFVLFAGVSAAFFLEHMDESFRDSMEAECSLGLPALGFVPDFKRLGGAASLLSLPGLTARTQDYSPNELVDGVDRAPVLSAAIEAYGAVRIGLLLSRSGTVPKVILITSGTSKEGKTVTAVNTAAAFARMGGKVLLIDADLRRSRCHEVLGISNDGGLSDVLTGNDNVNELVRPTRIEGMWCLTAGSKTESPSRLLGSSRVTETLLHLKPSFDHIVIDSPPIMPVTDSLLLASLVDGALLVINSRTPKDLVRTACSRLLQIRAPLLGFVFNKTDNARHYYSSPYFEDTHSS